MAEKDNQERMVTPKIEGGGLSGVAIRRPVFTWMMMIGLVVLGIFGFRQLAIDDMPEVDIPIVVVQTVYPGASPEVIEREVTRRMEEQFNPVEGVDRITSNSLEGVSLIIIEFDLDRNGDLAAQDIRSRLDLVRRELPADIEEPIVLKFDPNMQPIISLALSSDVLSAAELTSLADETVRRRLETVNGVGEVEVAGGLEREIRVFLDPGKMQALGISVTDITGALQRQNMEVPAGRLERGDREHLVRIAGRITDPAQFAEIIVANRNGQPVRLGQVARVEDGTEEERTLAFVNGERAVALDIRKISGANTVAVADGVMKALDELREELPAGTNIQVVRDNSVHIRQSVDSVIHELMLGALLTVLVVMFFLNDWKATVITSLALPVSVISAFILMNALGFTLNNLTLMALSLSIGILIDDAIIVIENIVRHREMGADAFTAAARGTKEIFLAVVATTLSIVAVFVPVAFMGGIIGRFFFQFGLTIAFAVLVSFFVSFTLTPMLSAHWGVEPHSEKTGGIAGKLMRPIVAFNRWFDRQSLKYRAVIEWALGHRKTTIGIAVASLVGAFMLFPLIGGGFMPLQDSSEFAVTFQTPEGSSIEYTRRKGQEILAELHELEGVDYTYATIGAGGTGTVTQGNIYVSLKPRAERDRTQQELMVQARQRLASIYGVRTGVLEASTMGGGQKPIQVQVRGTDIDEIQRISNEVEAIMAGIPGVVDIDNSLGEERPEYRIEVDREVANELGLDIGQVTMTVMPLMAGMDVTTWEDPNGEERDVVIQVGETNRVSVQDLATLPIATPFRDESGATITVPLGQIAKIEESTSPAQIDREDLQRVGTIAAATTPELSIAEASSLIQAALAEVDLPPGYSIRFGGETEQLVETVGYVVEAIVLAVILIFLILASQFESFTQPISIMLSLPLSLVGVLLALLVTNDTLNMMSMIGVILLMGLVTKNAILLVDNANERRRAGKDRWTALVEAGQVRLRPIMMTTLAMIFGMLPIALGLGEGGGFRAPMARAVIGGLITSTMLTLVVVPVAYTYFDGMGAWVRRRVFSRKRKPAAPEFAPQPATGD